ncbi:MAG: Fe-S cluster assembly ATPase SufC [Bacilli bacterium]|nr:Fe-S cluster assembly ATPase SufC [Bacilli bacterium]
MSLLEIKDLYTIAEDDHNKHILNGLNLSINPGEIHVIMGPNGSGKSTLANTILNNKRYIKTEGNILFDGEDITDLSTDKIAKKGVFMSFQIPIEIPGITEAHYLKSLKENMTGEKANVYKLSKEVEDNMNKLHMDKSYSSREFNTGFSGGEKKKNEILQLLMMNPKLAILDETDSGLDVDAIKIVKEGIELYKNDTNSILIITHSMKLLDGLKVDKVHVLIDGKIVDEGDISLAKKIDSEGYNKYINENNN